MGGRDSGTFDIGLVMAGAISAGAYTAGVADFLLEALDGWEAAKAAGEAVPRHAARIRALAGSSAGAMTAAILARALAGGIVPVGDVAAPPDRPAADPRQQRTAFRNPFFAAWVQSIDIRHLLGALDLDRPAAKLVSALDSTMLAYIGDNVLRPAGPPRAAPPGYVADPVEIFLTTTNLRGVPYGFGFTGAIAGYEHMMTAYADHMRFALRWNGAVAADAVALDPAALAPAGDWALMMNAALASGAFPVGLAPRLLHRKATDYDTRLWPVPEADPLRLGADGHPACACTAMRPIPPLWPAGIRNPAPGAAGADPGYRYDFWNVDGGLMDNEPLELARRALSDGGGRNPRDGLRADRAVVMIDPFPNTSDVSADYTKEIDLIGLVPRLFGALKEQARFKPDELALAAEPEVYSRFVVAPVYSDDSGHATVPAIASAVMDGFGGFFAESFRRHDFQLGRRNCQRFLQRHFVLPLDNPLFDGWRGDPALVRAFAFPDPDVPGRLLAPIVPLVRGLDPGRDPAVGIALPARPHRADVDLAALRAQVTARIDAVVPKLIDSVPTKRLDALARAGWWIARRIGGRGKIVDKIMDRIAREIAVFG